MPQKQHTQWARGRAVKENFTVGPRHDPYSRDVVTIHIDDRKYEVVSCGLAGEYMRLPDGSEVHLAEPPHYDRGLRYRARANYEAEVTRHTGHDSRFWMDTIWHKLDRARYRRDPKAYELQMQIEEAEDRAYGGYM